MLSAAEEPPKTALTPAFAAWHQPKPLGFDPAKLKGLSEKLIRSHWENNCIGSVKTLNLIEGRLAAAMRDKDFPAIAYGGLKREELHRLGFVVLHEHYFDNWEATASAPRKGTPRGTIPPPVPRITRNTSSAPAATPSLASDSARQLAPLAMRRDAAAALPDRAAAPDR